MKKIILILPLLLIVPTADAKTTVNVKVDTDVSTSGNNEAKVENDIRVETNGKVTTYKSDKPESIEIKSEDGVSEIKVNGERIPQDESLGEDNNASPSPLFKEDRENSEEVKSLFGKIQELFKRIFFFLN